MGRLAHLTGFDRLMLGNFVLWSGVILIGYRWRNLELYIYVLLVLLQAAGMFTAWLLARRVPIPTWVLLLLQVAVLLHLAGGSIFVGETRLYDLNLEPGMAGPVWFSQAFRFDKFVHGYFALVGVLALRRIWPELAGVDARGFQLLLILLAVMGICAIVEVLEYLGTKIAYLPEVGGYDNNLQDLLANLVGAGTGLLYAPLVRSVQGWKA